VANKAWTNQSKSLEGVQVFGSGLEKQIREILGWRGGKVTYDSKRGYQVQVDAAFPSLSRPQVVASVTYTNPDTPGHSNENKFHLKVGEVALLKNTFPDVKTVLILGGTAEAWIPYVLRAFTNFFDEVIFLWEPQGQTRVKEIAADPTTVKSKHDEFWAFVRKEWASRQLAPDNAPAPHSEVRYGILDELKAQAPVVHNPALIRNEVARICMQRSFDADGAEWSSYIAGQWGNIEMSRSFFNPVEATVEMTLTQIGVAFEGSIARNVPVPSLLHDLGMRGTRLSEDFVLFSEHLGQPVYIQCKASGGGRENHGKNIQNRAKEQITRSLLYSCRSKDGQTVTWAAKGFHWISVLDGNWGVTKRQPLKYLHMLQMAGYDMIFPASALLSPTLEVLGAKSPLAMYLIEVLHCRMAAKSGLRLA